MTATERVRELLDERGVEHFDGTESTLWGYEDYNEFTGIYRFSADETSDGYMQVRLWRVTPEQAIAATLGRGMCQQEEHGWSTEGDHARVWLTCGHDCMVETVADLPNYCPICGAEVMHA